MTHDQEEALALADRIAVMDQGKIVQMGPEHEVYEQPRTRFVTDFLGEANIFTGQVITSNDTGVVIAINQEDTVFVQSGDDFTPPQRPPAPGAPPSAPR